MKLYHIETGAVWVDPWGEQHCNQSKYVFVLEEVDVEPTGETRVLYAGRPEGGVGPIECPVLGAEDGRQWVQRVIPVHFLITVYHRLFEEPRDPSLGKYEIGMSRPWVDRTALAGYHRVNEHGRAVNTDGVPL